jgi:ferredoxin
MIINLPKLKNHQLMFFTGAMKNMFGLIPSVTKSPFHVRYPKREAFASMIVDLNMMEKPVYAFMDAVVAMEGPGPSGGTPRQTGLVLASSNFLAMDIAACDIIGYPSQMIPINRDALARKIWLKDAKEIEYPLLSPSEVEVPDFKKIHFKKSGNQLIDFILARFMKKQREKRMLPCIDHNICICCGDCTRICAPQAITLSGEGSSKKIEIKGQQCIRCYCCHEICPVKAIEV